MLESFEVNECRANPQMLIPGDVDRSSVAVLVSGGVESGTLVAHLDSHFERLYPVYVRFGLNWEPIEEACLRRFLCYIGGPHVMPLKTIDLPVADVYGAHWSTSGQSVPDSTTADDAVYLPGRNALLIVKTAVWCSLSGIGVLASGHLESNPFPDASAEFFQDLERVLKTALGAGLRIIRPLAHLGKAEVLRLGVDLPLELTFSCIAPAQTPEGSAVHCGRCNKCAERRRAFARAGLADATAYAAGQGL